MHRSVRAMLAHVQGQYFAVMSYTTVCALQGKHTAAAETLTNQKECVQLACARRQTEIDKFFSPVLFAEHGHVQRTVRGSLN